MGRNFITQKKVINRDSHQQASGPPWWVFCRQLLRARSEIKIIWISATVDIWRSGQDVAEQN